MQHALAHACRLMRMYMHDYVHVACVIIHDMKLPFSFSGAAHLLLFLLLHFYYYSPHDLTFPLRLCWCFVLLMLVAIPVDEIVDASHACAPSFLEGHRSETVSPGYNTCDPDASRKAKHGWRTDLIGAVRDGTND